MEKIDKKELVKQMQNEIYEKFNRLSARLPEDEDVVDFSDRVLVVYASSLAKNFKNLKKISSNKVDFPEVLDKLNRSLRWHLVDGR